MKKNESLQDIALNFVESRSESSFSKLYHRLKPGLRKMVMKYHHDEETINDILAITLSKAYVYVDTYDSRWNFSTWVYKICQNECLMELRRKSMLSSINEFEESNIKIKPIDNDDIQENPDYEYFSDVENLESLDVYDEILEEISNLPDPYRDILHDREVHKLKYEEIAEKRGIKINTVRSRIHVAKKLVRNKWIQKKRETTDKEIRINHVTTIPKKKN